LNVSNRQNIFPISSCVYYKHGCDRKYFITCVNHAAFLKSTYVTLILCLESAVYLHGHNILNLYRESSVRCRVSVEIYQQYFEVSKIAILQ